MKVIINEKEYDLPEISFFRASTGSIHNKEKFRLEWEVKNATHVELFKNGISFDKLTAEHTSRQISETYDGKEKDIEYSLTAWNNAVRVVSSPVFVRIMDTPAPAPAVPQIISFKADTDQIQNKKPFLLQWEVKNATQVDLYRNGIVFARLGPEKTSREITETYDGRDKQIEYSLTAINETGKVESDPVTVSLTNKGTEPEPAAKDEARASGGITDKGRGGARSGTADVIDGGGSKTIPSRTGGLADNGNRYKQYESRRNTNLKKIRIYLGGLLAAVIVAGGLITYFFLNKPRILDFDPKTILEEHTVVITGKNFPTDSASVQVFFNKIKGRIQYLSPQLMRVNVPKLGESVGDGNVTIAMVVRGDTSFGRNELVVTKRQQDIPPPNLTGSTTKTTPVEPPPPVSQNTPVVRIDTPQAAQGRPKKTFDIFKFVKASREFKANASGGTDLRITVQNSSPFDLDNVHVEVSYFKKNQADIKKETLVFPNVRAHLEVSRDILDGTPGTPVTFRILQIESRQLEKHLQG